MLAYTTCSVYATLHYPVAQCLCNIEVYRRKEHSLTHSCLYPRLVVAWYWETCHQNFICTPLKCRALAYILSKAFSI